MKKFSAILSLIAVFLFSVPAFASLDITDGTTKYGAAKKVDFGAGLAVSESGGAHTISAAAAAITSGTIGGTTSINVTGATILDGSVDIGTVTTFVDSDATPDVTGSAYWKTNTTGVTITDFDGTGLADGQIITVVSKGAITYDVTASGLIGGSTDLITANTDLTQWLYDGTDWFLVQFTDQSDNLA